MKAIGKVCLLYLLSIETDFLYQSIVKTFSGLPEHSGFVGGGGDSEVPENCVGANIWIDLNIMCISQDSV